jgi:hypothetical protein
MYRVTWARTAGGRLEKKICNKNDKVSNDLGLAGDIKFKRRGWLGSSCATWLQIKPKRNKIDLTIP